MPREPYFKDIVPKEYSIFLDIVRVVNYLQYNFHVPPFADALNLPDALNHTPRILLE